MIQIDIDMPKYCSVNECPLCNIGWREKNRYTEWCHRTNGKGFVMVGYAGEENKIPNDCPLKEVKRGKWELNEENRFFCSECEYEADFDRDGIYQLSDYCPRCGARMNG